MVLHYYHTSSDIYCSFALEAVSRQGQMGQEDACHSAREARNFPLSRAVCGKRSKKKKKQLHPTPSLIFADLGENDPPLCA
jgi:hypothetical protein